MAESRHLGWAPGQPRLGDGAPAARAKRDLSTHADILPELIEAEIRPRPMWKHPAFLLSIGLTFVALVVAAVLLILSLVNGGPAKVSGLELELGEGNTHLSWSSDGAPVDLYAVTGDEATDLSQWVRGDGAWIPVAMGLYGDDSCFVVRPSSESAKDVSLTASDLEAQGAQSTCVADAAS